MKIKPIFQPLNDAVRPYDSLSAAANMKSTATQARRGDPAGEVVADEQTSLVGTADLSPDQQNVPKGKHREDILDEALEETFPASDPISPAP